MKRRCARQFCDTPAAARVDFDGVERIVWLDVLGDGGLPAAASVLCQRHADGFDAPRHWELRDLRAPAVVELAESLAGPPPAPTVGSAAAAPVAGSPWSPHFDRDDDLDGVLDAKSPLLARAFRGSQSTTD